MTFKDLKTYLNQWVRLELTDGSVLQGELREIDFKYAQTGIKLRTFESDLDYYIEVEGGVISDLAIVKDVVSWKPIDPPTIIVNQDPPPLSSGSSWMGNGWKWRLWMAQSFMENCKTPHTRMIGMNLLIFAHRMLDTTILHG
ncbi:hypothetical protein [Helicobacter bizzozeronii]|nr:hypothetical protein [Helicobacter bizzozeronii]